MTNPLLTPFSLPPFSAIKPEHVVPAVTKALEDCRAAVESAVAHGAPYSWENLCQPLAEVDDVLGRIFSPVSHLNSVKTARNCARPTNRRCRCSPSTAPGSASMKACIKPTAICAMAITTPR